MEFQTEICDFRKYSNETKEIVMKSEKILMGFYKIPGNFWCSED